MNRLRQAPILLVLALAGASAAAAADADAPAPAESSPRVQLDKPLSIQVARLDKTLLIGELLGFDTAGFDYRGRDGDGAAVAWSELAPRDVFLLHVRLLDREGDPRKWLELGRMLSVREGGAEYADRALTHAARVDSQLQEEVDAIRTPQVVAPPRANAADADPRISDVTAPGPGVPAAGTTATYRPGAATPLSRRPPRTASPATPTTTPTPEPSDPLAGKVWGHLEQMEHEIAVARLKAKGADAQTIAPSLRLYETDYFLFYTDLGPAEARKWVSLLDRMYNRLLVMFDIPKGTNIWHGKALVFVFAKDEDFRAFEAEKYEMVVPWAIGLCHSFGNGEVHITFYRQADEVQFANLLVHESVHGFLHRYRSPRHVVSWVNEGLAEWIAFELVDSVIGKGNRMSVQQEAASELRQNPTLGGMFDAGHITPEQYLQTLAMTDVLIAEGRTRYVNFINAIKDGEAWEPAFEKHFGMTVETFLMRYSEYLNLPTVVAR